MKNKIILILGAGQIGEACAIRSIINNPKKIILQKDKILVCKKKGRDYYFFPGGHVEFGESLEKSLQREIKEEIGLKIKKALFVGGSEHIFKEDGKKYHEINFVFKVSVDEIHTRSRESHLEFFLFNKKELINSNVLPKILKVAILEWFNNKKQFWTSSTDSFDKVRYRDKIWL